MRKTFYMIFVILITLCIILGTVFVLRDLLFEAVVLYLVMWVCVYGIVESAKLD